MITAVILYTIYERMNTYAYKYMSTTYEYAACSQLENVNDNASINPISDNVYQ